MSERPVDELEQLKSAFDELDSAYVDLQQQNKRLNEAIERALAECVKDKFYTAEKILSEALEETE